ncbi:MAG: LytR/AlgR family response regulator transcription factor [Ignavibacteria bacterium]|jgi:DNA-binding LytR/AlgR family response regulator
MQKILIIEDDISYVENIKILLEEEGFDVFSAPNGFDGIDAAKNETPDLIICDIMLPDIEGYSILIELRKREKTKLIPFIFLTAKAEMSDLRKGMNLGADDYLTKPFHANDLLTAVRTRLEKANTISEAAKKKSADIPDKDKFGIDDYLFLPTKNSYEVLPVINVVCILSEGVYTNVVSINGKKILVRKLLKEWEETLPEALFLRINKSFLINIKHIKKVEKWFNGAFRLYLNYYGDPLIVSRRYAARLKKTI